MYPQDNEKRDDAVPVPEANTASAEPPVPETEQTFNALPIPEPKPTIRVTPIIEAGPTLSTPQVPEADPVAPKNTAPEIEIAETVEAPVFDAPRTAQELVPPAYAPPPPPPVSNYTVPPVYNSQPNANYQQYPGYNNRQQPNPTWNMYSPGMYADQPPPRDRNAERAAARSQGEQKRKSRGGTFLKTACIVLVCVLLSAAASYVVMDFRIERGDFTPPTNQVVLGGTPPTEAPPQSDSIVPAPVVGIPEADGTISPQDIYDMALTQVVGISVTPPESAQFAGMQGSTTSVTGSGFIVSTDGYILTNHHVIDMAQRMELPISVVLHDGTSFEAEIVGFDARNDVALLKIDASGLNPVVRGDSDNLRVGQSVYAVGNPFGDLVYTMTDGIVSALDRIVSLDGKSISTFQFSAAVNSGNSGGPIYDDNGRVIGIVTAKLIRGSVEGIGFAIPINDAIEIATALIEHGYIPERPLLGITARDLTPAQVEYYDIVFGTLVRSVSPGSAAEKAGIQVGDIITALDDEEIDSMETLFLVLRQYKAGDTATITVWRAGETHDLSITFDENTEAGRPDQAPAPDPEEPDPYEIVQPDLFNILP